MSTVENPSLGEWLAQEPFSLVMSSGFFGFYAHAGVMSALHERELLPQSTRGSSAGAMVTALWAAGMEPERMGEMISDLERKDFWDPGVGLGLIKGDRLEETIRTEIHGKNFEDCKVPIRMSVFDLNSRQTEVLDSGDLTTAIHAAIAFPGLFQPVTIAGKPKLDGGIKDPAGCHNAPKNERILHHNLRPNRYNIYDRGYHNSQTLAVENMPFIHPFNLQKGMAAFRQAQSQTLALLNRPVK